MKLFLETICIKDGKPQHLDWHQKRVDATLKHFHPQHLQTWPLEKCIATPAELQEGCVRCRIVYDAHHFEIHYHPYTKKTIRHMKVVESPADFEYAYKYVERNTLEKLYEQKGDSDDILMHKNGWITDTSVANIAFRKNKRWYTPALPLLAGTTWKRLITERILIPKPINLQELLNFESFKVFNALNDFDASEESSVRNIR